MIDSKYAATPFPATTIASAESGRLEDKGLGDWLGLIGRGAAMELLRRQLRRIGPHFRMVLLTGETGTGKELAARALHSLGDDVERPFVVCDLTYGGAISRGSQMEFPVDGTLFLDQIDEMSLAEQGTLLRQIERWERAQRTQGTGQRIVGRIIATASEDLRVRMKAGLFRQDLYYRIAMVEIVLPPLRERKDDIEELAEHFVRGFAEGFGKCVDELSAGAAKRLREHTWPGNVRELKNVLRSAVLQAPGRAIEVHHLSICDEHADEAKELRTTAESAVKLQDVVDRHVQQVLRYCAGNKVRAAELLGISRSTLYRMLDGMAVSGGAALG